MKKIIVLTLSILFIGCEEKKLESYSGYGGGYFGQTGIYFFDFNNKKRETIKEFSSVYVENIEVVDKENLIISTDNMKGDSESRKIFTYNLKTNEESFLVYGSSPKYFSGNIVYYNSDSKLSLYKIGGSLNSENILDEEKSLFRYEVVPLSDRELIYMKNSGFVKYNIYEKEKIILSGLDTCSFWNMSWIESKRKMLCAEIIEGDLTNDYIFIDLEGKVYERISFGNKVTWPVSYIKEQQIIVFQEVDGNVFSGEKYNLLAYDINSSSMKMVLNGLYSPNFIFSERK